jgi:hypothetical protein
MVQYKQHINFLNNKKCYSFVMALCRSANSSNHKFIEAAT